MYYNNFDEFEQIDCEWDGYGQTVPINEEELLDQLQRTAEIKWYLEKNILT